MPTTSKTAKTTKSTTAKKPADKKPAAKKAAPAKKPAAKKPEVKKAAPAEKQAQTLPAEAVESEVKLRNLFDAFAQGKLPFNNGYIVSSFFSSNSAYSRYEITSYAGVKEIFVTDTGLQFVTGGKKLYVLVEQDTYPLKFQEPVSRQEGERIPKRFSELEIIKARNLYQIMVAKEADETFGSFTILRPQGHNFAVLFYQLPDVYETLAKFFEDSLNKQRRVPQADAKKAALLIANTVEKQMNITAEYK